MRLDALIIGDKPVWPPSREDFLDGLPLFLFPASAAVKKQHAIKAGAREEEKEVTYG
jgi:hypothetical protein